MASKAVTLALAVVIVAILVFLILWFLNTRKQTEQTQHYVSPLSTIEHDVSSFVSSVKNGFTNVLDAGKKYLGLFWGLSGKELGNTVGFIEHGISSVEKDAENFVKNVYNTIGLGGIIKAFGGGAEKVAGEIEKGVENIPREIYSGIEHIGKIRPPIDILPPIENIPREVYGGVGQVGKYIPEIPTYIEKGTEGFVNEIKSILKRF